MMSVVLFAAVTSVRRAFGRPTFVSAEGQFGGLRSG